MHGIPFLLLYFVAASENALKVGLGHSRNSPRGDMSR